MKIGELYYGVSIPESEFRELEARLRRFEANVQRTGTRQLARDLDQTGQAAARVAQRIQELQATWAGLQMQYSNNEIAIGRYNQRAQELQATIAREMETVREGSVEWTRMARLRTQVGNALTAETLRLQRANEGASRSLADLDRTTIRGIKSSTELQGVLATLRAEQNRLREARERELLTANELMTAYDRLLTSMDQQKRVIRDSNLGMMEKQRALSTVSTAAVGTQREIDKLSLKLKGYNRHTLEAFKMTDTLSKAWLIGLGPQGYRLYLVLDVLRQSLKGLTAAFTAATGAAGKFGIAVKATGIGVMLATVGSIIAGVNQFMTLEDTMADVRKTTGLMAEDIKALGQAFRALTFELPKTTDELAQIAVEAGRLGVTGTRNLFDFTRAIAEMDLAVTGLGTRSATEIGRFLNVLGIETRDFGEAALELGGILNELENNTASTAGEILDMASGLAQISSIANMSMRDIFAFSAALSSMGIRAEMAGSNLTRIFVDVVTEVARGTEAVDQLAAAAGMQREEFLALTREQNGFSRAFQEVALNMGRANLTAEEFTLALESLGITNIRVRRVVTALAQGHHTLTTALEVANDEARTAESIQQELAIRMGVTRVQLQLLRNRFAAMVQIIGEDFVPHLTDAVVWINENITWLGHFGAAVAAVTDLIIGATTVIAGYAKGLAMPFLVAFNFLDEAMKTFSGTRRAFGRFNEALGGDIRSPQGMFELMAAAAELTQAVERLGEGTPLDRAIERTVQQFQSVFDIVPGGLKQMGEAFTEYADRYERIIGLMPDLADRLAELSDHEGRPIPDWLTDPDGLDGIRHTERTVQDVMDTLFALIEAYERLDEVEGQIGRESTLVEDKFNALNAALRELVMDFGLAATSPEVRQVMQMLEDLGVDAEHAMARLREHQEWLTSNWVDKFRMAIEFDLEDPRQTLDVIRDAITRLRGDAEVFREQYKAGGPVDWLGWRSLKERIDMLEAFEEELSSALAVALEVKPDIRIDPEVLQVIEAVAQVSRPSRDALEELYDIVNDIFGPNANWAQNQLQEVLEDVFPRLFGSMDEWREKTTHVVDEFRRMEQSFDMLQEGAAALASANNINEMYDALESVDTAGLIELRDWLEEVAASGSDAADAAQAVLVMFADLFKAADKAKDVVKLDEILGVDDIKGEIIDPDVARVLELMPEISGPAKDALEEVYEVLDRMLGTNPEWAEGALNQVLTKAFPDLMDGMSGLRKEGETTIEQLRRMRDAVGTLNGALEALAEGDMALESVNADDLADLHYWLLELAAGTGLVAEMAREMLEAWEDVFAAVQRAGLSDFADMTVPSPLSWDGERTARGVAAELEWATDLQDTFEQMFLVPMPPLRAFRRELKRLAEGEFGLVTKRAQELLRQFDKAGDQMFEQMIADAMAWSDAVAGTFTGDMFDPLAHELELLESLVRIRMQQMEHAMDSGASQEHIEGLQAAIRGLREEMARLRALQDLDLEETLDMSESARRTREYEAAMRQMLEVQDGFIGILQRGTPPLLAYRNALEHFARSALPEVAAQAGVMLDAFDREFATSFRAEIDDVMMASKALAGSFPEDLFDAQQHRLNTLNDLLGIHQQRLLLTALVYGANSAKVRELQEAIKELRQEIHDLEESLDTPEELEDKFANLIEEIERAVLALERLEATQITPSDPFQLEIDQIQAAISLMEGFLRNIDDDGEEAAAQIEWLQEKIRELRLALAELENQQHLNAAADESRVASQEAATEERMNAAERMIEAMRETLEWGQQAETAIQEQVRLMKELQKALPTDMARLLQPYVDIWKDRALLEGQEAFAEMQARIAEAGGETRDRFLEMIPEVYRLAELYGWTAEEVEKLEEALNKLSREQQQLQDLRDLRDMFEGILDVAQNLFDLFQDDGWTDGNKILDFYYDISARAAGAVANVVLPGAGPIVEGMVRSAGEFINAVLGDMSNGLKQVQREIDQMAERSALLTRDFIESITATHRVSRGGILGWLGFTKAAVDKELTDLNLSIAEGVADALKAGLTAAVSGSQTWKQDIAQAVRETLADAIMNALVSELIAASALAEFIVEFTRLLREEGAEAAAEYARRNMLGIVEDITAGVEEAAEILREAGLEFGETVAERIGSSIESAVQGAMSRGIMAALEGQPDWRTTMRDSIQRAVVQAVVDAFVEAALVQMALEPMLDKFRQLWERDAATIKPPDWLRRGADLFGIDIPEEIVLWEGGPEAAADWIKSQLPSILEEAEEIAEWIAEILEEIGFGITEQVASALSGTFTNAIRGGIRAALEGQQDWKTTLADGLKDAVVNALMDAFIEAMILTSGMQAFVDEFTRILSEDGPEAAARYARENMKGIIAELQEGAEIIARELYETGLITPPDTGYDEDDAGTSPNMFSLPTATVGVITATPTWVENLGMHFAKFGSYVDRLVDEGIRVEVVPASVERASSASRDFRLAR